MRVVTTLILHTVGAGLASPTVLITRPLAVPVNWLPIDNQSVYYFSPGESRSLELDTSLLLQPQVYITVLPCARDLHLALYYGKLEDVHLSLVKEYSGTEASTTLVMVSPRDKYILQLSSSHGGSVAVSVRGEPPRHVRLRLRVRSRRRLSANWDPSPIDPQSTTYCVVASYRKKYTSLCSAQHDIKTNRPEIPDQLDKKSGEIKAPVEQLANSSVEIDKNDIDTYNLYDESYRNMVRRKKFGRSTKITNSDPMVTCVGDRTHHFIENLDPTRTYFVSVFGVSQDRQAGSLLAMGSVKPKTSTAKKLKENVSLKGDIRSKTVYYFKTTVGIGGGLWLAISTCGGAVDVEVLVRGKRVYLARHIEVHSKFFIPAPMAVSSMQETSDEGSVQFDSSSEEARMRYVIKVVPARRDTNNGVTVEVTVSTNRWSINSPELPEDRHSVRELRPRRSCKSVDIAILPATHNATDVIRYCIAARETKFGDNFCPLLKRSSGKLQCVNHVQKASSNAIVQKIHGLKSGRKYTVHVTASYNGGYAAYRALYVDTKVSC